MHKTNDLPNILRALMDSEDGLSEGKLGEHSGVPQPTIHRILTGASKDPRRSNLKKIADYFNISVGQLVGEEPMKTEEPRTQFTDNVIPGPDTRGLVPLISWIQAGCWHEAEDHFVPGDGEDFLPCPVSHGPHTYALRVTGDSMTSAVGRSYPEGMVLYVDPDLRGDVGPGDRIVAKLNGENAVTFKELASDGTRMYLKALNPQHPPIWDEFSVLGKVIGAWLGE